MSVVLLFEAQVQPGRLEAYVHYALEAQRIWLRLTDAFQPNSSWLLMRLAALW